jgi:cytidylate kinase
MAAITISRQLGSLGTEIAHEVGRCMGWRVVSRELINQAAREAGAGEMALATIDDLNLLGLRPCAAVREAYLDAVRRLMHELADRGDVVILGRAGQVVLAGQPGVLHVRVVAPLDLRAERVARRHSISLDAAHAQIEASDRSRRTFLHRCYQTDWEDNGLYDLVINTRRATVSGIVELVCLASQQYQAILATHPAAEEVRPGD